MTTYISMIRGINVSGQKKIKMDELRLLYELLGLKNVSTYIQSGNVIFDTEQSEHTKLSKKIEDSIKHKFGFTVSVCIKTKNALKQIIQDNPYIKEEHVDHTTLYVTFLSDQPESLALKKLLNIDSGLDTFHVSGTQIYLHCPNGYARTKLTNNAFERCLSLTATTRNWRSVNKLLEIASK